MNTTPFTALYSQGVPEGLPKDAQEQPQIIPHPMSLSHATAPVFHPHTLGHKERLCHWEWATDFPPLGLPSPDSKSPLWIHFFPSCFLESTSQDHFKKNKLWGLLRIYLKESSGQLPITKPEASQSFRTRPEPLWMRVPCQLGWPSCYTPIPWHGHCSPAAWFLALALCPDEHKTALSLKKNC